MKTDSPLFRYRLYLLIAGALALTVTLLRTLALCLTLDREIGYFGNGFLTGALYTVTLLGAAACFILPLFLKTGQLPERRRPLNAGGTVCALLSAVAFAAAAICLFVQIMGYAAGKLPTRPAPTALMLLAAVACVVAALYFLLQLLGMESLATPCAYGVIFAAVLLLSITYFDRYTQMNAPHKVWIHLSLLCIMIYMLYELRARIGHPAPRALAVSSALLTLICGATGVSDLIAYAVGLYDSALYLVCDLILVAFTAYAVYRILTDAKQAEAATETEEAE